MTPDRLLGTHSWPRSSWGSLALFCPFLLFRAHFLLFGGILQIEYGVKASLSFNLGNKVASCGALVAALRLDFSAYKVISMALLKQLLLCIRDVGIAPEHHEVYTWMASRSQRSAVLLRNESLNLSRFQLKRHTSRSLARMPSALACFDKPL